MGVPTSEVGYTSATTGRGDHEVHKGHVVVLGKSNKQQPSTNVPHIPDHIPSNRKLENGHLEYSTHLCSTELDNLWCSTLQKQYGVLLARYEHTATDYIRLNGSVT
jgi:hypothetical protein